MPLTAVAIRSAKPAAKDYKLFDERGLFLKVTATGSKLWRCKYMFGGLEKLAAFGRYPEVSLARARELRDELRRKVALGVDPQAERRERSAARETFQTVALEWFAKFESSWAPSHARTITARLNQHVFPYIGATPIRDLNPPLILSVLQRVEANGTIETAHRIRQVIGQVLKFAIAAGKAERNAAADLGGALAPAPPPKHRAAITDPQEFGALLRALDSYQGTAAVRAALQLSPLVFLRPGELRMAEWREFDLDAAEWSIPAHRTKTREPLIVPLATQAVAILRRIRTITGAGEFVFPCARTSARPMSDNAILAALRRMGFSKDVMSGHGFRASARTMLDEKLKARIDIVEQQLNHKVRHFHGRAYNRAAYLDERRELMQRWADYCDQLKNGYAASTPAAQAVELGQLIDATSASSLSPGRP